MAWRNMSDLAMGGYASLFHGGMLPYLSVIDTSLVRNQHDLTGSVMRCYDRTGYIMTCPDWPVRHLAKSCQTITTEVTIGDCMASQKVTFPVIPKHDRFSDNIAQL